MGKYGDCAKIATIAAQSGVAYNPEVAWKNAAQQIFLNSQPSRDKVCPKGAFLGLCEEGLVKNIPSGKYTTSKDNKKYAVDAVRMLMTNPGLANRTSTLWKAVIGSQEKVHNGQMDVVISLWNNNLLQIHNAISDGHQIQEPSD